MDMLCKDSGDWLPASQCNVESPSAADQSQKKLRSDKESGVFEVIRKTFMAFWENRLDWALITDVCFCMFSCHSPRVIGTQMCCVYCHWRGINLVHLQCHFPVGTH